MHVRALVFAGVMAAMAAVLQTAPVWVMAPAGYALSILASLPAAVAVVAYPREAPYGILAAVLACLMISPQEALIFACTNGAFGLALGWSARSGYGWWRSTLLAAATLWAGMALLTWGVGVAALGEGLLARGFLVAAGAYAAFALSWSAAFTSLFRVIHRRIAPVLERRMPPQRGSPQE